MDAFNNLPLERQTWFHGKITADFAQGYLRRDGHFLVREDPAKPGSCFIVVRYKRAPINVALCKVNSSKGTRIKYRTEDSDNSFDSISELINYYVTEKKPLSSKTPAVITHAVSRDATLLSTDDFKNRYVTNTTPGNVLPPKPPGTGPLQQKKLDKYARKNSDPGLHLAVNHGDKNQNGVLGSHKINGHSNSDKLKWTTQPKQREKIPEAFLEKAYKIESTPLGGNEAETETEISEDPYHVYEKPDQNLGSDNFYDKPNEPENPTGLVQNANKKEICGQVGDESYYDRPHETEIEGSFYDEPSVEEQAVYDRPPSTGSQKSLGSKSKASFKESQENLYDRPRANTECLFDGPNGSQDNLYDKPAAKPKRMREAFQKSDSKVSAQVETSRPQLVTRSSAPTFPSGAVPSSPRADVIPEKRHSGAEVMARQSSIKDMSPEGIPARRGNQAGVESKPRYSTPPKKPNRPSLSRSRSEQSSPVKQEASLRSNSIATDGSKEEGRPIQAVQESPKPVDRKGIFLNVMKKIGEKLLVPFLESDCLSLARHMTRVDLVSLWGDQPHRHSWSIEDGTGGAKGLEILTLPQGREKRAELLQR